ncbi:aminopeptidase [Acetobacter nitrogenifigens DSM 23921 = NBRC 105050]|uniref:Aminopeptidase n=1 Tax=Acetobacter nitrogenifigens DSM 23921 = NBRC 105050 TaxID=1120919 RepID=A0A511X6R9_9PROT|nr:M1 family metallopeptidase [Acetobacter nitrogenifigens]GBQ98876.1 aminopeptidase [Acetobacter nitrogenifigens DSM 23921 = NBRC 105050]GEN58621.1 aminopeptidase [Acetobacter nitrogenifigens DSM 23921 = NBRC 105050]
MRHMRLLASTLLCGAALLLAPGSGRAEAPFSFAATPGQLPKTVTPRAYDIALVTDMAKLTLSGEERVTLDVLTPTNTLVMNQAGLTVGAANVDGLAGSISHDEKAQTVTIRFPRKLTKGAHRLTLSYSGPIIATPNGLYYDDYKDASGAQKRMLVTQFEVADARRMFPCWDEPVFKATFHLTVTLPKAWTPISNMPVEKTEAAGPDAQRVTFAVTPRMSTYLLALLAGEMSALHGKGGDTPINVFAPTGEESQGAYALSAASEILPYYNGYFGTSYPLPKLDLIAVPGNYEAGAMENWGAITFIDEDLLFDRAHSASSTKELVYLVVAHEMAHQWSGDLVTMAWWDNVWLNEGFATWMETKALDHFNPGWEVWPREHSGRESAMAQDALSTTHPIQQVIADARDADQAFDRISYQKGEQVIRMIETWLGPDVFRDGMRRYMKAHAYSNATSEDLWNALSAASKQDVGAVAKTFTEQPGIPLVHVARTCVGGEAALTLSQSRFAIHDPHAAALNWRIPIVIGGPGVTTQKVVLTTAPATVRVAGCDSPAKVNLGEGGYYRTVYDDAGYTALKAAFARLDMTDRVNLLGDQFALFESAQQPLSHYLDLVANLSEEGETSIAVWQDTLSHLRRLDELERGAPERPAFRAFVRSLLAPQLARLGWAPKPGESFLNSMLRPDIIETLGLFGDPEVTAEAQKRFAAWRKDPSSLDASLVEPVTQIVGLHADAATWDVLADALGKAPDTERKRRFFAALARSQDPALIEKTFHLAYSGAIPNGRIGRSLVVLARDSEAPDLVWKLTQSDQAAIRKRLAPWSQTELLPSVASVSLNPKVSGEMLADPASSDSAGARLAAARGAEQIATSVELASRTRAAVAEWLTLRGGAK